MIGLDKLKMAKLIDQKLASISEVRIGQRLRGYAVAIYKEALPSVPQWSGNMVANLRLSVNGVAAPYDGSFYVEDWRSLKPPYDLKNNPNSAAMGAADTSNATVINNHYPSMRDTYSLGYAEGAHSDYFASIEAGNGDLRDVNQP